MSILSNFNEAIPICTTCLHNGECEGTVCYGYESEQKEKRRRVMNKSEQLLLEVLRPQGEWKMIGTIGLAYKCDKCGEVIVVPTNYCPNCGAKMKGGAE